MKLGFIGLGIMGTPMAINLARAGHQLHVTTIGPVADELLSLGAVSVETARQVTEASDIIFIMVPDTPQVEEVLFGENGCTKASLKGKTIVDMSSISPIETKRFARQVNELGGDYLDELDKIHAISSFHQLHAGGKISEKPIKDRIEGHCHEFTQDQLRDFKPLLTKLLSVFEID